MNVEQLIKLGNRRPVWPVSIAIKSYVRKQLTRQYSVAIVPPSIRWYGKRASTEETCNKRNTCSQQHMKPLKPRTPSKYIIITTYTGDPLLANPFAIALRVHWKSYETYLYSRYRNSASNSDARIYNEISITFLTLTFTFVGYALLLCRGNIYTPKL